MAEHLLGPFGAPLIFGPREDVTVTGVKTVIGRLFTKRGEIASGMERGLWKAGFFLQERSQEIVPVATGRLRNSAYTTGTGRGFRTKVEVGYSGTMAPYAIFVHEDLFKMHKPGKTAKFLEIPHMVFRSDMVEIIRKEAQIR